MGILRVGAAKRCIDPPPGLYPIPSSFADWGQEPLLQEAVYDNVFCRAIVIDNGEQRFLAAVYETMGYPGAPGLKEKLAGAAGVPVDHVLLAGTHNHSAPKDVHSGNENSTPEEVAFHKKYWQIEEAAGLEAVREAVQAMRPAKYGYGEGLSYVNVNRDVHTPFGYWVEGKNLGGYSDRKIRMIKFVDEEENLIAVLGNYGMHNTCIHMMRDFDGKAKTSGNVSGIASRFVEEHYGNGAVAIWTSGCAGNQNPLLSHNLQYEYPDGYSTSVELPDGVGFMMMEYMGRTHGADCVRTIDAIAHYSAEMPISAAKKIILLPGQKRRTAQEKHAMFRMGGNGLRKPGDLPALPEVPEMIKADDVRLEMTLSILGGIAMIGIGGEPYAELGRDLLDAVPCKNSFIVTHIAADSARYILDKGSKDKKVFQAFRRVVPGSADELIVDAALDLFRAAGGPR
ncbi:MAG: hypothetical protein NC311_12915 [Muribaculaceae bacterium]|nr:hypothetical protein [Muribaculaceae bacterium]